MRVKSEDGEDVEGAIERGELVGGGFYILGSWFLDRQNHSQS